MSEEEKNSLEVENPSENEKADEAAPKKSKKKKKLIIGLSIGVAATIIVAIALPIALTKLFPSINMSFLKNYQAQIDDAEALGISLESKRPSLVKKVTSSDEIESVRFVKKGNKKQQNKMRSLDKGVAGYFNNADGILNRFLVYEDYTLVEYVAKKETMTQQEDGGPYYYYPAYYRAWNSYDSWVGWHLSVTYREDQFINSYSVDKYGITDFDRTTNFMWNKTHQSFVIDNRTGYIYPLDFLKIGENISVVNNALVLSTPNSKDYYSSDSRLIEFGIENDNLVISNVIKNEGLSYSTIGKDKYGQYYIAADILNDQMDAENKIYAFSKNKIGSVDYNASYIIVSNKDNQLEMVFVSERKLTVFGDNFTKYEDLDEYSVDSRDSHFDYVRNDEGEYIKTGYHFSYPCSYPGSWCQDASQFTFIDETKEDWHKTFNFYSLKAITDFENDELVIIGTKQREDSTTTLVAYSIPIKTIIERAKNGSYDVSPDLGTVIFEGFDSYRYYKDNIYANFVYLEIKANSLSGTEVYVLSQDEDGKYAFVHKESFKPIDITITIAPINV